jgi:DNA-binding LacI/PurR family transcriptional regulator
MASPNNERMPQARRRARAAVTLKDVADRVGVTAAAASMALAGHGRISDRTREAVRRAADELGYVPSSAGRALRQQRSGAVALIVPNTSHHVFGHSYFMHVLTGLSTAANSHGAQVIVSTNADGAGGIGAYERVMRSGSADGAIVTSAAIGDPHLETLVALGLPVVLIGNFPYLPGAVSVGIDDVAATEQITGHLIDVHGRTNLVHVTGPLEHQAGLDRRDGFLRAVRRRGLDGPARIINGDFSETTGAEAIGSLLASGTRFDGVVFANDDMAFGGLQVLRAAAVQVPDDVAVAGFDDFGLARLTTPGITTVRVPAEEMARLAAEFLFAQIEGARSEGARFGGPAGPSRQQLPVTLVFRESCGCR